MAKSLELPEARYKLTKKNAHDDDALTYIEVGRTCHGHFDPVITVGECFYFYGNSMRDQLRTSIVKDFTMLPKNKVSIQTENSVYLLEEVLT